MVKEKKNNSGKLTLVCGYAVNIGGGLEINNDYRKGVLVESGSYDTVSSINLFYLQQYNHQKTGLNSPFVIKMV